MQVLMLTLFLVVLGTVTALPPPRRGSPAGRGSAPGASGPAPAPGTPAPAPAAAPAPGSSPFLMSPPAPPRSGRSGNAPSPPGGPPSSGRLPHGIPRPPATPGQAPPEGPRDQGPRDPSVPIMPSGDHRGSAPGSEPRPADTPDVTDQASRDAMPETCTGNAMMRSSMSCSTYYVCSNGRNYMMQCPGGLHFDPRIKVCNWPQAVNCVLPTTTTTTQEPTTSVDASTRAPVIELPDFDEECKDEIVIRTKKMDNGIFLVFQCFPGFGYFPLNVDCDRASKSCTFPINVTPPNPNLPGGLPLPITTVRQLMSDDF